MIVHRHATQAVIVQTPEVVPGSRAWKSRLLAMTLFTVCIFLAVVIVLLLGQLAAGAIPAAETWVGMAVIVPAVPVLAVFALREISAARPCRITVSPVEVAVRYGAPLPRPFRITRGPADLLKAELYHRTHRNYASSRSYGSYNIALVSRIPYVRCGGRLIGPMDEPDAETVATAMNAALHLDQPGTAGSVSAQSEDRRSFCHSIGESRESRKGSGL